MEVRIANNSDWEILETFYKSIYKDGHPLLNYDFWNWQFNTNYGKLLIGVKDNKIVGHLGLSISDNYAWHINLYIKEEFRSSNLILSMLKMANDYGKQGNLSANKNALDLYRSLKWYQYANLERKIIVNPELKSNSIENLISPIVLNTEIKKPNGHFWKQPTLKSIEFEDGSTAIIQNEVAGVRFVTINDISKTTKQSFEMGFKWCDYITSFNNPRLRKLEKYDWKSEEEISIPWLLNPIIFDSKSRITFLSKEPIDINFYITRMNSDIGRVGSIINSK